MSEQDSSYKQILKATSIFGGVQVFGIIISIVRSKFIAVLLGPTGIGIAGLLSNSIGLISALTNFGLGTSAVRDVAAAYQTGDTNRVATVVTVLRKLVWFTGLLGCFIMFAFSNALSVLTFGNSDFSLAYKWISLTLLFSQLSSGQLVVLQGMRKLQQLALASLTGNAIGILFTVPLYYVFGLKGIVPAIIGTSVLTTILAWGFARKIQFPKVAVSPKIIFSEGKHMLTMGFLISVSSLIMVAFSYIITIFISKTGGVDQVGLYTAGFTIINTYAGLIFTAMGTDYYPRLSAVAHDDQLSKQKINEQAEIAVLLLAPIILSFFVCMQQLLVLVYSEKFIGVAEMINWAALGMFFKAASWSIAFIFLAKGTSKQFFWNELIANLYVLVLNLAGYHYFGLTGLGISFMLGYLFYFIQVFIISRHKYNFGFEKAFRRIFAIQLFLAIGCFLSVKLLQKPMAYGAGGLLVIVSAAFSYKELDKRIELSKIISGIKARFIK